MNKIFFEYPDESTIVIKRNWNPMAGILGIAFVLVIFILAITIEAQQNEVSFWEEFTTSFQNIIDSFRLIFLFASAERMSNFGINIALACLFILPVYWILYLFIGLFDPKDFLRRRTTVDGNNRRVELILRKDLDFHDVQAIYFRPIHRPTGGLKNTYLIALLLTDGRKYMLGECRKRRELDKAVLKLSGLIEKPIEEHE